MSVLQEDIMAVATVPVKMTIQPIPVDRPGILYRQTRDVDTVSCIIKRIAKRLANIAIEDFVEQDIVKACEPEFIQPQDFHLQKIIEKCWTYTTYDEKRDARTGLFFQL